MKIPWGKTYHFEGRDWRIVGVDYAFCDRVWIFPDGIIARLYARYEDWVYSDKVRRWIVYDALANRIPEGAEFPSWTLGYWLCRPIVWMERHSTRANLSLLERL